MDQTFFTPCKLFLQYYLTYHNHIAILVVVGSPTSQNQRLANFFATAPILMSTSAQVAWVDLLVVSHQLLSAGFKDNAREIWSSQNRSRHKKSVWIFASQPKAANGFLSWIQLSSFAFSLAVVLIWMKQLQTASVERKGARLDRTLVKYQSYRSI